MVRNTRKGHIGLMPLFLYRQSWEQLPEPYQMCRNIASGYNKCHSQDNQYNSATQSGCQTFPENCYSEEYSRYRFQSSEDGCRGRTYILHSVQRKDMAVGKIANAIRFPHKYHLSTTCRLCPKSTRTKKSDRPKSNT